MFTKKSKLFRLIKKMTDNRRLQKSLMLVERLTKNGKLSMILRKQPAAISLSKGSFRLFQEANDEDIKAENPLSFSAQFLEHNIPGEIGGNSFRAFWVRIKNTGTGVWQRDSTDGRYIGLAVFMDGNYQSSFRLIRDTVNPGEVTHICFTLHCPKTAGTYELKLDMFISNDAMFGDMGSSPLIVKMKLSHREKDLSEIIGEKAERVNYWYFKPSEGIYLSKNKPAYPLYARSAGGYNIVDMENRVFIDYVMGWGSALLGYANPRIQKAIERELSSAAIITLSHHLEVEVSEQLRELIPSAEMSIFGKNGSDACTVAARMARAYTGKMKILCCGFHGWQDWYAESRGFRRTSVPERDDPLLIHFPYLDLDSLSRLLDIHSPDVAAIMMEPASPVESIHGPLRDADSSYLESVASLAKKYGTLLIFDEIMSGFRYRSGSAQKAFNVTPDLTCLGKALSSGMPLSAVVGKGEIFWSTAGRIEYYPSFKGEAYSLAAARESLKIYRTEDIPSHIWDFGEKIGKSVNELCAAAGLPGKLEGPPFRMTMVFDVADEEYRQLLKTLLQQELLKCGIITAQGFMLPSYAHDDIAYKKTVEAFEKTISVLSKAWRNDALLNYLEIPNVCY